MRGAPPTAPLSASQVLPWGSLPLLSGGLPYGIISPISVAQSAQQHNSLYSYLGQTSQLSWIVSPLNPHSVKPSIPSTRKSLLI